MSLTRFLFVMAGVLVGAVLLLLSIVALYGLFAVKFVNWRVARSERKQKDKAH